MKIQLKLGEKLTVGFYTPKEDVDTGGWSAPEDMPQDGEFTIEFSETSLTVKADMPDDKGRGGQIKAHATRIGDSTLAVDAVIYEVTWPPEDEDDAEAHN